MKKYWKSIEEKENEGNILPDGIKEWVPEKEEIIDFLENSGESLTSSRRDFLKFCGFSFAATALISSCKNPVNKAIPYLVKPEDVYPGEASHYASAYYDGKDFCNIVVKTRDGRPIKIEGNEFCPVSRGGTTARIQASVLSLYDEGSRLKNPIKNGNETDWSSADREIISKLQEISASGGKTVILTSTLISPSLLEAVSGFLSKYPNTRHISYDAISMHGIREAHRLYLGQGVIPAFHFDKADLIVGINCDFLGTWLSPGEFTCQYAATRRLREGKTTISRHIQIETALTLTGSNADERITVNPSEEALVIINIYRELALKAGIQAPEAEPSRIDVKKIAGRLWENRAKCLLVCGTNDVNLQVVVSAVNDLLNNYGSTLTMDDHFNLGKGDDKAMAAFVDELSQGQIAGVIIYNVNPAYDYPGSSTFAEGLKKAGLTVSLSPTPDETAGLCQLVCPDDHYLEAWSDAEPRKGTYSVAQPAIQ
ncbi:MAG: molybdopterin oxidoreductase, partial [Bacteroidetes bacterium]|nr:molybdopterin oxidoreductase [Bacteroidota bacterium]